MRPQLVCYRENLERPGEIEHLDVIEEQDGAIDGEASKWIYFKGGSVYFWVTYCIRDGVTYRASLAISGSTSKGAADFMTDEVLKLLRSWEWD